MGIRRVKTIDDIVPVRNAVISVYDKQDIEKLGAFLLQNGVNIYSTGGTYKRLRDELQTDLVQDISSYTGMPETEGGLVKSLHHKPFLGYLTETYSEAHQNDLKRENAVPIDLFVGNFYPFEKVISDGADIEDARGNIDVGGPSALRAAAKNWHRVAAVVDPADYKQIIDDMSDPASLGCTRLQTRFELHKKAYRLLADYNKAIADFVEGVPFEEARKAYEVKQSG